MLSNKTRSIYLIVFLIILAITSVKAQTVYYLIPESSHLEIKGSSTVHDWDMNLTTMTGELRVIQDGTDLSSVSFSCKAKDLISDNSIMNSKTQDALKSKKYPIITFVSKDIHSVNINENLINGKAAGTLFIAGESQSIEIPFKATLSNAKITVTGNKKIYMSDFNIEPPTAMLGALKTGDEITIEFNVVYKLK